MAPKLNLCDANPSALALEEHFYFQSPRGHALSFSPKPKMISFNRQQRVLLHQSVAQTPQPSDSTLQRTSPLSVHGLFEAPCLVSAAEVRRRRQHAACGKGAEPRRELSAVLFGGVSVSLSVTQRAQPQSLRRGSCWSRKLEPLFFTLPVCLNYHKKCLTKLFIPFKLFEHFCNNSHSPQNIFGRFNVKERRKACKC